MNNGRQGGHFTTSVSGGTYVLIGIGVGIASGASASLPMAFIFGAFWPATLGYWAMHAFELQQYAAGG